MRTRLDFCCRLCPPIVCSGAERFMHLLMHASKSTHNFSLICFVRKSQLHIGLAVLILLFFDWCHLILFVPFGERKQGLEWSVVYFWGEAIATALAINRHIHLDSYACLSSALWLRKIWTPWSHLTYSEAKETYSMVIIQEFIVHLFDEDKHDSCFFDHLKSPSFPAVYNIAFLACPATQDASTES